MSKRSSSSSRDGLGDAWDRKKLRSSLGEADSPKITLKISRGVAETKIGDDDVRKLRKRKDFSYDELESRDGKRRRSYVEDDSDDEEYARKPSSSNYQIKRTRCRSLGPVEKTNPNKVRTRSSSRPPDLDEAAKRRSLRSWKEDLRSTPSTSTGLEKRRTSSSYVNLSRTYVDDEASKSTVDSLCWTCHRVNSTLKCYVCPRRFHLRCVALQNEVEEWMCPECCGIDNAESVHTRSEVMKSLSLDQLCKLLHFALQRMKNVPESQEFWNPVDPVREPFYHKYIRNPMDLNLLEKSIKKKMYGSTQAFLADAKWLLHNSIIFNSNQSPLTSIARTLVKVCRQELSEIDNCPECYLNAHTAVDWFIQICKKPHLLIWARLKGFPFWPAKLMSVNSKNEMVDARFFGAHDRAWVHLKDCFLLSKNSPTPASKKRGGDLDTAFSELKEHIEKIRQKYGLFNYASDKTSFLSENLDFYLSSMIPAWGATSGVTVNQVDNVAEENLPSETPSPEEEVMRNLELTNDSVGDPQNEADDSNSGSEREVSDKPIPEHGYTKSERTTILCTARAKESQNSVPIDPKLAENSRKSNSSSLEEAVESTNVEKNILLNKTTGEEVLESPENLTSVCDDNSTIHENKNTKAVSPTVEKTAKENEVNGEQCITDPASILQNTPVTITPTPTVLSADTSPTTSFHSVSDESTSSLPPLSSPQCFSGSSSSQPTQHPPLPPLKPLSRCSSPRAPSEPTKTLPFQPSNSSRCSNSSVPYNTRQASDPASQTIQDSKPASKTTQVSKSSEAPKSVPQTTDSKPTSLRTRASKLASQASLVSMRASQTTQTSNVMAQTSKTSKPTIQATQTSKSKATASPTSKAVSHKTQDSKLASQTTQDSKSVSQTTQDSKLASQTTQDSKLASQITQDFKVASQTTQSFKPITLTSQAPKPKSQTSQASVSTSTAECLEVEVKQENYEQYLNEENQNENLRRCKIKVRDLSSMGNARPASQAPMVSIVDINRLKTQNYTSHNHSETIHPSSSTENEMRGINRKLRLSDEVSLHVVDGEGHSPTKEVSSQQKQKKTNKAQKSVPSRLEGVTISTSSNDVAVKNSSNNLNVISVDTLQSDAQKNLLKSLCLEEKKKNGASQGSNKTQLKTGGTATGSSGAGTSASTIAASVNSSIFISPNGQAFLAHPQGQNVAVAHNNVGQISLVQLTNLTSGIHTNFVNLTNETLGVSNNIGAVYATPSTCPPLSTIPPSGSTAASSASTTPSNEPIPKIHFNHLRIPSTFTAISPVAWLETSECVGRMIVHYNELRAGCNKVGEALKKLTTELYNGERIMENARMENFLAERSRKFDKMNNDEDKYKRKESVPPEVRAMFEAEKTQAVADCRNRMQAYADRVVTETKKKQWCAHCGKEALFYCCWNTSYCDYPCQQAHWPGHMATCAQVANNSQANNLPSNNVTLDSTLSPMVRQSGTEYSGRIPSNVQNNTIRLSSYSGQSNTRP